MLISHIISLSFYHFSTRFPLTKSFNSYSPQKNPPLGTKEFLLKWKKNSTTRFDNHCVIWHNRKTSLMKAAGCFKMILDNARMGITRVFSEKQTHLTCILAKFDHPDGKSRNACVGASKQRFNKVEVKSLPRLSKKYEMMSKFDSNLFGSDNKIQDKQNHLHPEVLWWKIEKKHGTLSKSFRSHWSSGLVVWPNLSGDMQEAEDPIAIRSTSAQPPTSKIAIWNAHLLITISTKQFVILDHLMFFWGFLGRSFLLKIKLCKFVFVACFLQHHEKWAARKAILDNLQLIFGQGLQVWNREENSHQWPPSKRL